MYVCTHLSFTVISSFQSTQTVDHMLLTDQTSNRLGDRFNFQVQFGSSGFDSTAVPSSKERIN